MNKSVLLIDGENFIHKVEQVLKKEKVNMGSIEIAQININTILSRVLGDLPLTKKVFYAAKLHAHKDTKEKSAELIEAQKKMKENLTKQDFLYHIAGNVRAQKIMAGKKKTKVVFREKGVDVRIAVDLVALAADKKIKTAILCSSDSDLQPAVSEAKKRGVEIIYLGFAIQKNRGLSYTSNKTFLIQNIDVLYGFDNRSKTDLDP